MKNNILKLAGLLVVFALFFVGCSEDDGAVLYTGSDYDGTYSGYVYDENGSEVIGDWAFIISSGVISASDLSDFPISGTVDEDGAVAATATDEEGLIINVLGTISGSVFTGTWIYEDESNRGILAGETSSGNDGLSAYDGIYSGEVYADGESIGNWAFIVDSGTIYSSSGSDFDLSGTVNEDGEVTVSTTDDEDNTINVSGTISGDEFSGTWVYEDGSNSGTMSGSKE